MTIYFDKEKIAYSFKIENPICTISDEIWQKFNIDSDSWEIKNGQFCDLTQTDEYKAKLQKQETEKQKDLIQKQLEDLDKKRVRAIAEPTIKDSTTGETWLEYYNLQIKDLRAKLAEL